MLGKFTTDETNERGQVGIGTLIVFIAMVLVAAIAAGVLINTAGVLQTQASDTGSETQEQVANQIEVLHASGDVGNEPGESGTVESVDMTLMKSAGSNEIDLQSMTVQYTSAHTDKTLVYGDEANTSHFSTAELSGDNDGNSLTTKDDRVELTLDTQLLESNGDDGSGTLSIAGADGENDGLSVVDGSTVIGTNPEVGGDLEFDLVTGDGTNPYNNDVDVVITIDDETVVDETSLSPGDASFTIDSSDFVEGEQLSIDVTASDDSESVEHTLTIDTVEDLNDDAPGLAPGTSATVALVDQSGAQFTYGISVPSTFGTASVVEV